MNLDELLLNVNDVRIDSLVCQSDIQSDADKRFYSERGYHIPLTEKEFCDIFPVDPACVWYTPSISTTALYLNKETLAAGQFPVDLLISGVYPNIDGFVAALQSQESKAADNNFISSILALPDALRMDYFKLLVDKKGASVPGLYELFFSFYTLSDYGFNNIDKSSLDVILKAKTDKDREKTREMLQALPEQVRIYRGGNTASTPYSEAYSWSLDINVANFFACRRGTGDGYLVEAKVEKKDIIEAFLEDQGEQEIIVDPSKIEVLREVPIRGLNFLQETLPAIAPMYHEFKGQLETLCFAQDSEEHGPGHEARVMLLALTLSHILDLPLRDRKILASAAIYHDVQRVNDCDDTAHGRAGREYYRATTEAPDPLVEFLCEYHCLPDEAGYREIESNRKLSKSRSRSKLLFDIFKDADALDRVRFGIKSLDINQLRLPVSKELSLIARLYLEQVKIKVQKRELQPSLEKQIKSAASLVNNTTRDKTKVVPIR